MLAYLRNLGGFLRFVLRRWSEDRCPQIAGSLTYTTLLALVPVFAIAVAMLSSSKYFEDVMNQFKVFLLLNLLPEIAGTIITVYMEQFARNAGRLTTIGLSVLVVMAIALMFTIDKALNGIWRVGHSRPYWISAIGYAVLLFLAPLLIGVSMSLTTYLLTISVRYASVPEAESVLIRLIPAAMSAGAFFLLYRVVPHRKVPWRHALVGGVVAAVLFEIAKEIFAYYIRHAPGYSIIYGTFALVPIFMLWVFLSWLVVLFGAELTACLDYWEGERWRRTLTTQARFAEAVAIGRRLIETSNEPLSMDELRMGTGIARRDLEAAVARLCERGWLAREGDLVRLAHDPHDITLADFFAASMGEAHEPVRTP